MTLEELDARLKDRAEAGPDSSYTARLLSQGVAKCAQKLGEEAVETVIAATSDPGHLAEEGADLLYHFLVTLRAANVPLSDVMHILQTRTARSGLDEKAARTGKQS